MRLEVMSTRTRQNKYIAQTVIHLPSLPFQYFKNLASAPFTGSTAIPAGCETWEDRQEAASGLSFMLY